MFNSVTAHILFSLEHKKHLISKPHAIPFHPIKPNPLRNACIIANGSHLANHVIQHFSTKIDNGICATKTTIANEILMYLRKIKPTLGDAYLSDPIGTDKEGNQITLQDKLPDEGYTIDEQISLGAQIELLREVIKILSGREQNIVKARYGLDGHDEETQREIAARLNISRSYVSRIEKKALKLLLRELGKLGLDERS